MKTNKTNRSYFYTRAYVIRIVLHCMWLQNVYAEIWLIELNYGNRVTQLQRRASVGFQPM